MRPIRRLLPTAILADSGPGRWLKGAAGVLAGMLLLMSTALLAGRPSVFFDTDGYYLMGENLTQVIKSLPEALHSHGASLHAQVSDDDQIDIAIMGARSPYYGLLLYATDKIGGAWLLAAVQALVAAWMVHLAWRVCAPGARGWTWPVLAAGLAVGSTAALFATFMMPDIFAGVAGIGLALLLAYGERMSRLTQGAVFLVLAASYAFHATHWLTALAVLAPAVGLLLALKAPPGRVLTGAGLVVLAAMAAIFAGKAYDAAFQMRTGHPLGHPPFLMARLLADGPGRAYLQKTCTGPDRPFIVCRFKHAALNRSDDILWEDKPGLGVFSAMKPPDQLVMEKQEAAFVKAVVLYDPMGVLGAALRNWRRQLFKISTHDPLRDPRAFLANPYWVTTRLVDLIPDPRACKPFGPGCAPILRPTPMKWWHVAVTAAAVGFGLWRMSRSDVRAELADRSAPWSHESVRLAAACIILIGVVVVNAGVCGVLSGAFARYQARIVWLVPLAAGLIACALGSGVKLGRAKPA